MASNAVDKSHPANPLVIVKEQIRISDLDPSRDLYADSVIRAVVTLIWPYSSFTGSAAVLLADQDFKSRRQRGQIRIQFNGSSGKAVGGSRIGIGDLVTLSLQGARWAASVEAVKTPGQCVDGELHFNQKLTMEIVRDNRQLASLNVDNVEASPELQPQSSTPPRSTSPIAMNPTPISQVDIRPEVNLWSSPAFFKRSRASDGRVSSSPLDPSSDEDRYAEGNTRKRTKLSRLSGRWRYQARTPSPEKDEDQPMADVTREEQALVVTTSKGIVDAVREPLKPAVVEVSETQPTALEGEQIAVQTEQLKQNEKQAGSKIPGLVEEKLAPDQTGKSPKLTVIQLQEQEPDSTGQAKVTAEQRWYPEEGKTSLQVHWDGGTQEARMAAMLAGGDTEENTENDDPQGQSLPSTQHLEQWPRSREPNLDISENVVSAQSPPTVIPPPILPTRKESVMAISDTPSTSTHSARPPSQPILKPVPSSSLPLISPLVGQRKSERGPVVSDQQTSLRPSHQRLVEDTEESLPEDPFVNDSGLNFHGAVRQPSVGSADSRAMSALKHDDPPNNGIIPTSVSANKESIEAVQTSKPNPRISQISMSSFKQPLSFSPQTSQLSNLGFGFTSHVRKHLEENQARDDLTMERPSKLEIRPPPSPVMGLPAVRDLSTARDGVPIAVRGQQLDGHHHILLDVHQGLDRQPRSTSLKVHSPEVVSISRAKSFHQAPGEEAPEFDGPLEPGTRNDMLHVMDENLQSHVRDGEDRGMQDEDFATNEDYLNPDKEESGTRDALVKSLKPQSGEGANEDTPYISIEEHVDNTVDSPVNELMVDEALAKRQNRTLNDQEERQEEIPQIMDTDDALRLSRTPEEQHVRAVLRGTTQQEEMPANHAKGEQMSESLIVPYPASTADKLAHIDTKTLSGAEDTSEGDLSQLTAQHESQHALLAESLQESKNSVTDGVVGGQPAESLSPNESALINSSSNDSESMVANNLAKSADEHRLALGKLLSTGPVVEETLESAETEMKPEQVGGQMTRLKPDPTTPEDVYQRGGIVDSKDTPSPASATIESSNVRELPTYWLKMKGSKISPPAPNEQPQYPHLTMTRSTVKLDVQVDGSVDEPSPAEHLQSPKPLNLTIVRESTMHNTPRNSNVPDIISPWFSPRRSRRQKEVEIQKSQHKSGDESPVPEGMPWSATHEPKQLPSSTALDEVETGQVLSSLCKSPKSKFREENGAQSSFELTPSEYSHFQGFRTPYSYYTSLSSLPFHLNAASSSFAGDGMVDVIAVVTSPTKHPQRARAGPRDYYTVMHMADPSTHDSTQRSTAPNNSSKFGKFTSATQVEIFRPFKLSLPAAERGDVVLLRNFVVKSRNGNSYLLSGQASAWMVWRWSDDSPKPVEERKGPPVEFGDEERTKAKELRTSWQEAVFAEEKAGPNESKL